jgi:hypothetical protein
MGMRVDTPDSLFIKDDEESDTSLQPRPGRPISGDPTTRPYPCDFPDCGKAFARRSDLARHGMWRCSDESAFRSNFNIEYPINTPSVPIHYRGDKDKTNRL